MPRDQRLYMTFPNDFWMHPKVAPLSVEAKWTFVEMNGYSRMQDLDGSIPKGVAARMWSPEVLAELASSHPDRPLVVESDESFVIRDYAEHQQTVAERDRLSQIRSEAGKAGRSKQLSSKGRASARANAGQASGKQRAESESESESETEITSSKELVARKRASTVPLNFTITDDMRTWGAENTPLVNLDAKLPEFIDYWRGTGAVKKDWVATWRNGMRKQQEFALRDAAKAGIPVAPRKVFKAHAD